MELADGGTATARVSWMHSSFATDTGRATADGEPSDASEILDDAIRRAVLPLLSRGAHELRWRPENVRLGWYRAVLEASGPEGIVGSARCEFAIVPDSDGGAREAAIMNAVRVATETIKQEVNRHIMQQVSKSQSLFGAVAA